MEPGIYPLTGPLVITAAGLTLQGLGNRAGDIQLIAANNKRVTASLIDRAHLSLVRNLSIIGGKVNTGSGGGIRVEAGAELSLIEVEVLDNFADQGGGLSNAGTTTIMRSLLAGNDARGKGGGIESSGVLTVTNTTFTDNEGKGGGGLLDVGRRQPLVRHDLR